MKFAMLISFVLILIGYWMLAEKLNALEKENQALKEMYFDLWQQVVDEDGDKYNCLGRRYFEEAARYLIDWGFITQDDLKYEV